MKMSLRAQSAPSAASHSPVKVTQDEDYQDIDCPFCNDKRTSLISLFGGNAGESLLQCHGCNSIFHWIKWQGKLPPHPNHR